MEGRDQDWEEEEGKERTRRKQTRHNQEVTMIRERKRLNEKDPFRVPPHCGIDCLNFSQIAQNWENFQVSASYVFFLDPSLFLVFLD